MRICFYINDAYFLFHKKEGPIGGTEVNLYLLAKEFAKYGKYNIFFVVGDYGQQKVEVIYGIKIIKLPYYNKKYSNIFFKILRKYFSVYTFLKINADIYITSVARETLATMRIASWFVGSKLIFRVAHDWDVDGTRAFNYGLMPCDFTETPYQKLIKLLSKVYINAPN